MSAANLLVPFIQFLPLPDGIIGASDRQHAAGYYTGVSVVPIPARNRISAINLGFPYARFPTPPAVMERNSPAWRAWNAGFYGGLLSDQPMVPDSTAIDIGSIADAREHYRFATRGTAYEFRNPRTGYQFQVVRTERTFSDGRTRYYFAVKERD